MEDNMNFTFNNQFGLLYRTYFTLLPTDLLKHFGIFTTLKRLCFPYYSDARREINSFIYSYKTAKRYGCLKFWQMIDKAPPAQYWINVDDIGNAETKFFLYSFYKLVASDMEIYDNDIENVDVTDFGPEAKAFASMLVPIIVNILTNFGRPLQKNGHSLPESPRRNLHLYLQHCGQAEALAKVQQFYKQDKRAREFIPDTLMDE